MEIGQVVLIQLGVNPPDLLPDGSNTLWDNPAFKFLAIRKVS